MSVKAEMAVKQEASIEGQGLEQGDLVHLPFRVGLGLMMVERKVSGMQATDPSPVHCPYRTVFQNAHLDSHLLTTANA